MGRSWIALAGVVLLASALAGRAAGEPAAAGARAVAEPGAGARAAAEPAAGALAAGAERTGRVLVSVRAPAAPSGDSRRARARRSLARERSGELLGAVARRHDLRVEARSPAGGLLAVEPGGLSPAELRRRLASDPRVTSVRAEGRARLLYDPDDPAFLYRDPNAPGGDFAQWNLAYAGFPRAWELGRGEGGEVAVLDSGVYVEHPDLSGRVSGALDCAGPVCLGSDVGDQVGHGTHVAGLACADSDNGYGIASGGFGCSIYAVRLDLSYTSIINAIYAAADHGSDAINMSFGGGGPDPDLKQALDYAWARGSVPVAAAANEPTPMAAANHPAQYVQPLGSGPDLEAGAGLVVTSARYAGERSAFAQRGEGVSVAAYGSATDAGSGGPQGILSTWPPATPEPQLDTIFENRDPPAPVRMSLFGDDRYAYLAGTSMAAPQVAGLVAQMRAARPGLSAARLVRLLKLTASGCGGYAEGLGWGRIDADVALGAALDLDRDPPGSRVRSARPSRKAGSAGRGRKAGDARDARRAGTGRIGVRLKLKRSDSSCSKELPRAGIGSVTVFASIDGRPYKRLRKTRRKSIVVKLRRGARYRFYTLATDRAGNREAPPAEPDAKLRT